MKKDYTALLKDLGDWRARREEIAKALERADAEEKRLSGELEKMREQLSYYRSLTGDMKKEMQPASVSSMIKSM